MESEIYFAHDVGGGILTVHAAKTTIADPNAPDRRAWDAPTVPHYLERTGWTDAARAEASLRSGETATSREAIDASELRGVAVRSAVLPVGPHRVVLGSPAEMARAWEAIGRSWTVVRRLLDAAPCYACGTVTSFRIPGGVCLDCFDAEVRPCVTCGRISFVDDAWDVMRRVEVRRTQGTDDWATFDALFGTPHAFAYYVEGLDDYACENCVSECDACGATYANAEDASRCCECDWENCYCGDCERGPIHGYGHKPSPRFHWTDGTGVRVTSNAPRGTLFLGVELEMERMAPLVSKFQEMADEPWNAERFVYWKSDGSLGGGGAELVTHPATLDAFAATFPWEALANACANGARSFAFQSTGFHVHVSRSAFENDAHAWRFVKLFTRNVELSERIGQRTGSNWAKWDATGRIDGKRVADLVKRKTTQVDRYVAVSLSPRHTIELRFFKGNAARAAILRNLQFVDAAFNHTKHLTFAEVASGALGADAFVAFVHANRHRYADLSAFLTK